MKNLLSTLTVWYNSKEQDITFIATVVLLLGGVAGTILSGTALLDKDYLFATIFFALGVAFLFAGGMFGWEWLESLKEDEEDIYNFLKDEDEDENI